LKSLVYIFFKVTEELRWLLAFLEVLRWNVFLDLLLQCSKPVFNANVNKIKSCSKIL